MVHEDSQEWQDAKDKESKEAREEEDAEMRDAVAVDDEETSLEYTTSDNLNNGLWDPEEEEIDPIDLGGGESDHEQQENGSRSEDEDEDVADVSDNMSQASELSVSASFDLAADCKDDTNSMISYNEKHAYDPTKLSREDVQWIDRARVLAVNLEWEGEKKAYLSGRGRYDDYFDFEVIRHGKDPRDTHLDRHAVYHVYETEDSTVAYPMHEACYGLLIKCITNEKSGIDKDVLYAVMQQNTEDLANSLNLDYGGVEGAEQFWECYAGEEWSVADPATQHGIEKVIQDTLPTKLFDQPSRPRLNLGNKVQRDTLAMLPYDVLHDIFAELSMKDTLKLMHASWHVFNSTCDPAFWRLMIRVHIRPFFWELDNFFQDVTLPDTFDWRGMFQWLNKITKGEFGMSGPLMHIANRRRIWEVCQQIVPMYYEKLNARVYVEPSDEEAAPIMSAAKNFHMPRTLFPKPAEPRLIKAQFIRSWSEIKYRGCNLGTYWGEPYNRLVGISVDFGSGPRIFGSRNGREGQGLRIKSGDWIRELRFSLTNLSTHYDDDINKQELTGRNDERSISRMKIDGMKAVLTSGEEKDLAHFHYDHNQRTFTVLPGMHLIGLEGEIGSDGIISSIALLQAPDPETQSLSIPPAIPLDQSLLWTSRTASFYVVETQQTVPIWSHPTRSHHAFSSPLPPPTQPFLHPDFLAYTVLDWAESIQSYAYLARISCLQVLDEDSTPSIIGIKTETTHKHSGGKDIGTRGPVPAQIMDKWSTVTDFKSLDLWNQKKSWEEEAMRHFEIDGPGGERVVEVHVTMDRKGLKLVTSRGREGSFGQDGKRKEWDIKKAGKGEVIVGLSVCFGRLGGWSEGAKMWSHFGASDFGVIIAKENEE